MNLDFDSFLLRYSWTNDMQVVVDDIFESLKDQELTRANEIVDSTLAEWRQILKLHQHLQVLFSTKMKVDQFVLF